MNRCTGHCCRRFTLPVSPEDLRMGLKFKRAKSMGLSPKWWTGSSGQRHDGFTDNAMLCDMLIYLGQFFYDPKNFEPIRDPTHFLHSHHYTCKYFNKEKSVCDIYEWRPHVCREYPDQHSARGKCGYIGCTSSWKHNFLPPGRTNEVYNVLEVPRVPRVAPVQLTKASDSGLLCGMEKKLDQVLSS